MPNNYASHTFSLSLSSPTSLSFSLLSNVSLLSLINLSLNLLSHQASLSPSSPNPSRPLSPPPPPLHGRRRSLSLFSLSFPTPPSTAVSSLPSLPVRAATRDPPRFSLFCRLPSDRAVVAPRATTAARARRSFHTILAAPLILSLSRRCLSARQHRSQPLPAAVALSPSRGLSLPLENCHLLVAQAAPPSQSRTRPPLLLAPSPHKPRLHRAAPPLLLLLLLLSFSAQIRTCISPLLLSAESIAPPPSLSLSREFLPLSPPPSSPVQNCRHLRCRSSSPLVCSSPTSRNHRRRRRLSPSSSSSSSRIHISDSGGIVD